VKHQDTIDLTRRLLSASLDQLISLEFELPLPKGLELYRKALVAFHHSDVDQLSQVLAAISDSPESWKNDVPCLENLVRARLEYRTATIQKENIPEYIRQIPPPNDIWAVEFSLFLAAACESIDDFFHAMELYKQAAQHAVVHDMRGKALRARFGTIMIRKYQEPERKMIPDFHHLYLEAKKLRHFPVATVALVNISQEYQKMGAGKVALKFAHRAVIIGSRNIGSQEYSLALAQRALIFAQAGRKVEAMQDFEEARLSPFKVVQGACAILEKMLRGEGKDPPVISLTYVWQEQMHELQIGKKKIKLSPGEETLLHFLSKQPRNKFELMEHIFPDETDVLVAENRLKNLLHRLRKKAPGLLVFENEEYRLADNDLLSRSAG
jgi:tetratricopeptide (TPR) repeat protein